MDNYKSIQQLLSNRARFYGNSMWADWFENHTVYRVYSYSTEIASFTKDGRISLNPYKYSSTTSRHQNLIKRAWGLN